MSKTYWQHYSHPADMGIRGVGQTKEQAFAQAALALTAVITDLNRVEPKVVIEIGCEEQDDELLFVSWLNALIFEMATRSMLFSKFEVKIKDSVLSANVYGEKIDLKRHNPAVEVKAATYTDLKVRQFGPELTVEGHNKDGGWMAQCIVDV